MKIIGRELHRWKDLMFLNQDHVFQTASCKIRTTMSEKVKKVCVKKVTKIKKIVIFRKTLSRNNGS